MNMDFADAMRAATQLTRAQKLIEATRLLHRALSGRGTSAPPHAEAAGSRAIEGSAIDITPKNTARDRVTPFNGNLNASSEEWRPQQRSRTLEGLIRTVARGKLGALSLDALGGFKPRR